VSAAFYIHMRIHQFFCSYAFTLSAAADYAAAVHAMLFITLKTPFYGFFERRYAITRVPLAQIQCERRVRESAGSMRRSASARAQRQANADQRRRTTIYAQMRVAAKSDACACKEAQQKLCFTAAARAAFRCPLIATSPRRQTNRRPLPAMAKDVLPTEPQTMITIHARAEPVTPERHARARRERARCP